MKRCPKCSRTYPDDNQKFCTIDGGLLATADADFDPNATIQSTSYDLSGAPAQKPTGSSGAPDLNRTVASSASAPTEVIGGHRGAAGAPTIVDQPAPRSAPLPSTSLPGAPPATAPKKSKMPMILGLLLLLLVLGVGAVVAAFFLVIKPRLDERQSDRPVVVANNENQDTDANENANIDSEPKTEDEYVPPAGSVKLSNAKENLDGKLAEHYLDFSFYYPESWRKDPSAGVPGATNFAKVERRLPPDFTQENFAVGWYTSKGTFAADESTFPQLVEILGANLAKSFPEYRKISEGPTKVNSLDGYEFRFVSVSRGTEKGDIQLWGRVVFLPTGVSGDQTGATLIMLATSLAPELSGVNDVGEKGELPVILESFRFGRKS